MKRLLFSILSLCLLVSCYKDKGNYSYHFDSLNNIELDSIKFSPEAFESINGPTIEVQQPLTEAQTERRITVSLKQTLSDNLDNLDFLWRRTYTNEDKQTVTDTLRTKGYIDLNFPMGKSTTYSLMLEIHDNSTGLAYYKNVVVKTRPIFQNSLFVLHGNDGARKLGNIEIIGNKAEVRTDAWATAHPNEPSPYAKAANLIYSTYYDFGNRVESRNLGVFFQDGAALVYEPYGLELKFNSAYLLPRTQSSRPFVLNSLAVAGTAETNSDYKCIISQDGYFYTTRTFLNFHIPAEGLKEEDPLNQTDYEVSACAITDSYFVLWDKKHNRFLYVSKQDNFGWNEEVEAVQSIILQNPVQDALVDFSALGQQMSPVGKQCIYAYINDRENYPEAHPFFVFKDASSGTYYRYELTPNDTGGKGDKKSAKKGDDGSAGSEPAFSITGQVLQNFAPTSIKAVAYSARFSTDYLFYAEGGTVYRYNVSNGDRMTIYSAPEGYTVSVLKFRSYDSGNRPGDLGRWLSIGMNKGAEGAVAEVKLTTAADVDAEETATFYTGSATEHFGNIKDLQFAPIYTYSITN